ADALRDPPSHARRAGDRFHDHAPRPHRIEAVNRPQQFAPPRPENARDAEDFAAVQRQAHAARQLTAGEVTQFQERLADRVRYARELLGQLAADHLLDDLMPLEIADRPGAHAQPVAEDREPIGNRLDLFEEVADVNDAHAAVAQPADER